MVEDKEGSVEEVDSDLGKILEEVSEVGEDTVTEDVEKDEGDLEEDRDGEKSKGGEGLEELDSDADDLGVGEEEFSNKSLFKDFVSFESFARGRPEINWNFKKEYPGMFNRNTSDLTEIWVSEQEARVKMGARMMNIKLFLWIEDTGSGGDSFTCHLGFIPTFTTLDQYAKKDMEKKTKNQFMKNPYFHLIKIGKYSYVFVSEDEVSGSDLDEVKDDMRTTARFVLENLKKALSGTGDSRDVNGWSILLRSIKGSLWLY